MARKSKSSGDREAIRRAPGQSSEWASVIFLGLVVYGTSYLYSTHFGLYEDDYIWVMTLQPMSWSGSQLTATLQQIWRDWVLFQGRPLCFSLYALLGFLFRKCPGLQVEYLSGLTIQWVNACLVYHILRRIVRPPAALFGAIALIAFPADTSKALLMHRSLHLAATLVFLSILAGYSRRTRFLAYLLAALSLLFYEAPYLGFFLAPLFWEKPRRSIWLAWAAHLLIFFAIAAIFLIVRQQGGDARANQLVAGLQPLLSKIFLAGVIGFRVTLQAAFGDAPSLLGEHFAWQYVAIGAAVGGLFWLVLRQLRASGARETKLSWTMLAAILLVACLGIAFAHCLSFRGEYFPPTKTLGRLSGLHMGAALSFAVLMATLAELAFRGWPVRYLAVCAAGAVIVATWVAFGVMFQDQGLVESWKQQSRIWEQAIMVSGQLRDHDLLVVDLATAPSALGFGAEGFLNSKSQAALGRFVSFPKTWQAPPQLVGYASFLTQAKGPGEVYLKTPVWGSPEVWPVLRNGSFYFLRCFGSELIQVNEPVKIGDQLLRPKQILLQPDFHFKRTHLCRKIFDGMDFLWQGATGK